MDSEFFADRALFYTEQEKAYEEQGIAAPLKRRGHCITLNHGSHWHRYVEPDIQSQITKKPECRRVDLCGLAAVREVFRDQGVGKDSRDHRRTSISRIVHGHGKWPAYVADQG